MTTEKGAKRNTPFTPGFWALLALGGLLGLVLSGDVITAPLYFLLGTFSVAFAWAYLFLQWAEMISESITLLRDPIPLDLNIADRAAVHHHIETLTGRQQPVVRARNLLQSWSLGWNPRQVIALASYQSSLAGYPVIAGGILSLTLLIVGVYLYANPWFTWGGMALLAITMFARQSLLVQVNWYLETNLLSRLPGNISQTAMTAADLAEALGGQIRQAFKDSVPQPHQTADAIRNAVENVIKQVAGEVEKLQHVLVQSQSSLVDRWMHAAEATTSDLKDVEAALSTIVNDLTGGLSTNAEKLTTMFASHTKDLDKTFGGIAEKLQATLHAHAEQLKGSGGDWGARMKDVLSDHVNRIEATNHELADQLEKIATLEKNIENVLKIQQVVEGSLKTVAASEEFAKLVSTLREHLQASDTLLREISKPRTIRLVETEGEISAVETPPAAKTTADRKK